MRPKYGRVEEWAAARLDEFDLDVPLTAAARSLSLAERQLLEVVKVLLAKPKVLLLDEPTTALGPEDVERLHALVFEQSRAGVGVVYVSHRLPEVLGIADRDHRPSRRRLPGDVRSRRACRRRASSRS